MQGGKHEKKQDRSVGIMVLVSYSWVGFLYNTSHASIHCQHQAFQIHKYMQLFKNVNFREGKKNAKVWSAQGSPGYGLLNQIFLKLFLTNQMCKEIIKTDFVYISWSFVPYPAVENSMSMVSLLGQIRHNTPVYKWSKTKHKYWNGIYLP